MTIAQMIDVQELGAVARLALCQADFQVPFLLITTAHYSLRLVSCRHSCDGVFIVLRAW